MTNPIDGQVVMITGAGRGIGRGLAVHLAERGARVGLLARTATQLAETATACSAAGARVASVPVDVADQEAVESAVAQIESELGPTDLAVANAGISGPAGPLWVEGRQSWWATIEINLGGALALSAAVLDGMVRRGHGRLVLMDSLIGMRNGTQSGAYAVSKAGMSRLGGVLGSTLAGTGVGVFDVSPGMVRTAMTDVVFADEDIPDDAWTPMERICGLVEMIGSGGLDALSGRFVHANDDWAALATRADEVIANNGRTLGLRSAFAGDPLG
jgi:3-oxoacyl-[acyl-carrier protein] reductase